MAIFRPGFAIPSLAGDRAGGSSGKNSLYASFIAWKSAGSTRKTVVLTTDVSVRPSSSRIDAMFVRHCRVWPAMSGAAHSPAFPPGRMGAWAEMKTSPFATTQWEYGPRGFGCFGRSGTAFTIVPRRQRKGDPKRFRPGGGRFPYEFSGFYTCKGILSPDGVLGGTASTPTLARGIPDGQERPRLPHWRRRRRWRVIDRGELREDVRAERAPHLDVFVLPERHPRRPRLDPDPRQPRSRALPRGRPGRRRRAEPAVDGRPPGGRRRGRRDRVRPRRHETGSGQVAPERAAHRHPASEEGPDPVAEHAHAEHGRPRRGRQAVRHRLPTRRERLQSHLGGQEAGDRAAEHRRREARRGGRRPDGRVPEPRIAVQQRGEIPDDGQRGDLPGCPRRGRQVPRAVPDDAGLVDPPLDGVPRAEVRRRREAGRGRTRGDEHDGGRRVRRRPCDAGDLRGGGL